MKKLLFRILLVAALCVLLLTVAFAEENTYYLSELDMEMTIPEGYYVMTRDTPEDDPAFTALLMSKSEFMEYAEEWYIYLDAIAYDISNEIVVTMLAGEFSDLNNSFELAELINSLGDIYVEQNIDVLRHEVYQHKQTKTLKIYFRDNTKGVHGLQYYITNEKKAYNITLRSYGGQISSDQEDMMKSVIDSVKLDASKIEPQNKASLFLYVDHEADVSFTVPGNWEKGQPIDTENASGSEFYSEDYSENCITYWSSDLWEQQTDEEKEENPRSVINNSDVTYRDIAEMYDLTRDEVSEVTYNGAEYFKVVTDAETAPVTQLVRFDNGWMYEFEFVGTESDAAYADFEKLLGSVKYPNKAEAVPEKEEKSEAKVDKGSYSMIIMALAILAAAGIVVLVIGIIAENRNKQRQEKLDQRIVGVCQACGHRLPDDSLFCQYCGTKIRKKGKDL